MADRHVNTLDGDVFVVSDESGDIETNPKYPTGLFSFDTRFLSKWILTINGERLHALSNDDLEFYETRFFLAPGEPTHYVDAKISVIRHRLVAGMLTEQLTVLNHDHQGVDLHIRLDAASDFADIFEIKDLKEKQGSISVRTQSGALELRYDRESFSRTTIITPDAPADVDQEGFSFKIHLEADGRWETTINVETLIRGAAGRDLRASLSTHRGESRPQVRQELDTWIEKAPRLVCEDERLETAYWRSLADLAALQRRPLSLTQKLPCAGLPWFMAFFGRDSLFTCLQSLPYIPHTTPPTLRALANVQGSKVDEFRDEEPGKIMHEIRFGETSAFEEQPHSPYYGSADSTPLFLILLDEYRRWSGDDDLVRCLEQEARAAVRWMNDWADPLGSGYIWYETKNSATGLVNQCWKDSWDSISDHGGALAGHPRATCELQGYAYDARLRAARLAREVWDDPEFAAKLETEAASLKERFNRDFWVSEGGYYALALDGDGRQIDSLSSNIGHLLWSGIVDDDKVSDVVEHLLGPRLFSGWGIRTLAVGEGRYNPIGYHVGTVWPFDNSIIAAGLARYGYRQEAARIAESMLDASEFFAGRLPEAFAGYDRSLTKYPVEYPTACSPQAWSSGSILLFLTTLLGLEPHGDHLIVNPVLTPEMGRIELFNISGPWGHQDAFGRGPREQIPTRRPHRRRVFGE
ncbi:glycogen debranching N-terminal domain-containing protein [Micromonospora andamanensis]|uniref:Amylo-alpha-1,6-glucosidase n=1 Tax=Micromonospora andamanensis TaxID=1287068 RepID=A0ABQ4I5K1_9ACTN|nr:glycogen debranching N-terminal domain-containing protein [Micromonospora andamanensis]GIJ13154.1 amylo-alpha-1,6-glucosidase [Micromonospora andamanensis]